MKIGVFRMLQKTMDMTLTVFENEHEAVAALRAATRILKEEGLTWTKVLSKTVTVIDEFEADPARDRHPVRPQERDVESLLAEAERKARSRDTMDFIASLRGHFEARGRLTDRQREALQEICNR